MSGFNDWIFFDPKSSAGVERLEEVDVRARAIVAQDVESRLRGRIDPGVTGASALRAQAVRVRSEGDRLVIDADDQDSVLAASTTMVGDAQDDEAGSVEELFAPGSGVPTTVVGPQGETRMVFRTISIASLIGDQKQGEQDRLVEQTMTDVLRNGLADAYEQASVEVSRQHGGDR